MAGTLRAPSNGMTLASVGRALFWTLIALLATAAALTLALSIYMRTDAGRRSAAAQIEKVVTDNIPGQLRIGSVQHVGFDRVVARDVRFYHPSGKVVLLAKHAEVVPDLAMALSGKLGFERAAVDGGFIELAIDPDGRLSLEAALDAPSEPGVPDDPNGGLHYWLRSMHTQHLTTVFALSKAMTYRVYDTTGFVGVRRIDTPGVQVTLEKISGRVEPELAGVKVKLAQVEGWARGKELHIAHFDAQLGVGSGELRSLVDYFDRKQAPLKLKIQHSDGIEGTLMSALLRVSGLLSAVEVDH